MIERCLRLWCPLPMKERYEAQWKKCQILNTVRARRLQTSRKCHWLDNMHLTELTLDKSTSISSKINREMGKEQRGGNSRIITRKRRERFSYPWWKRSKLPRRGGSKILQRQLKNWKLMDLQRKTRKTDLPS